MICSTFLGVVGGRHNVGIMTFHPLNLTLLIVISYTVDHRLFSSDMELFVHSLYIKSVLI